MGFFSWKTQNSDRSICNVYQAMYNPFPVTMLDNKGNKWVENAYGGYGEFGGKDFYELLAEMNGKTTRDEGITIQYHSTEPYLTPNLIEGVDSDWVWVNKLPEDCPDQGFFYGGDDDEDDDDEEHW